MLACQHDSMVIINSIFAYYSTALPAWPGRVRHLGMRSLARALDERRFQIHSSIPQAPCTLNREMANKNKNKNQIRNHKQSARGGGVICDTCSSCYAPARTLMSRGCEQAPCKRTAAAPTLYFCNIPRRYEDCSNSSGFDVFSRRLRWRIGCQRITGLPRFQRECVCVYVCVFVCVCVCVCLFVCVCK